MKIFLIVIINSILVLTKAATSGSTNQDGLKAIIKAYGDTVLMQFFNNQNLSSKIGCIAYEFYK